MVIDISSSSDSEIEIVPKMVCQVNEMHLLIIMRFIFYFYQPGSSEIPHYVTPTVNTGSGCSLVSMFVCVYMCGIEY